MANSVDSYQPASLEAGWSEFALFAKWDRRAHPNMGKRYTLDFLSTSKDLK